ncbi:MAG: 50S ribosomal protein L22 [Deltaproteobacteria bacterium]|nr:50S ribosomal protein L22 [Deltaproteobacteria bacterium]
MEVTANLKYIRVTPRKAMLVADLVRGKNINEALAILKFSRRKRIANHITGLLKSAVANADQKGKIDIDTLFVKRLEVGKGPTLKRFRPRAMGRAFKINKKTCHISVSLAER